MSDVMATIKNMGCVLALLNSFHDFISVDPRDKTVGEDITKRRFDIVGKLLGSPTFNARMNALKEVPVPSALTTALISTVLLP